MNQEHVSEFGGVVGVILRRSMSWHSAITGLFLGFVLMVTVFLFTVLNSPAMMTLTTQAIIALVLSRFAVNGIYGEWGGNVFSNAGGNWAQVGAVAARYMTLTAAWMLPLFFMGLFSPETQMSLAGSVMGPAMGMDSGLGTGKVFALFSIYMVCSTLTPPLFLIVSVSAIGFGDIFSPQHWSNRFSGRLGDLFLVFSVYAGALGMVIVIGIPILLALTGIAWQLAVFVGIVGGVFALGLALNLLGRLCGFFAFGESGFVPAAAPTGGGPGTAVDAAPIAAPIAAPTASAAPVGPSASVSISGTGTAGVTAAAPGFEASETVPADALPGANPEPVTQGLPLLEDASEHVQTARKRFATEPDRGIRMLEELRETHAPHPQVLHALILMNHEAGHAERALELARDAVPLMIQRGNAPLAAQIFKMYWKQRGELELSRDELMGIAGALSRTPDVALAANTYALVLQSDKRDARAIKGILQIADALLREKEKPADALRLYQYLLKTCPESPLVDYMREGMDESQKRLAQAKAS